ncbi:hypothetical protein TIFTF001_051326 [Ficus carica]|uniref:Uncharacterized protein n=1 Tax=Ficus carica TaxID=3494 RepID=A0AA87Z1E2_FICCA|nr:hypothetical protein TIFTF001_051326 [Ficus carica]
MLKSVMALVSKQRGKALARKIFPYMNKWADPLFISVPYRLGCSSDLVGLNSECPLRVYIFESGQAAKAGDRTGTVASGVRCQAEDAMCCARVLLLVGTGQHDVASKGSISTGKVIGMSSPGSGRILLRSNLSNPKQTNLSMAYSGLVSHADQPCTRRRQSAEADTTGGAGDPTRPFFSIRAKWCISSRATSLGGSHSSLESTAPPGDCSVYTVDYFTSAVNHEYLESLREEFQIVGYVEMVVPGPNDLPSRPPPGYVTLSAEFFRAGLRLPFHPFLA